MSYQPTRMRLSPTRQAVRSLFDHISAPHRSVTVISRVVADKSRMLVVQVDSEYASQLPPIPSEYEGFGVLVEVRHPDRFSA